MCKHEEKYCPRCQVIFECKVGNILQCQCYDVELNEAERAFVSGRFHDCLCGDCLLAMKMEFAALPNGVTLPKA